MKKTHYKLLVCLMIFLCLVIIPTSFAADADAGLIDENTNSPNSLDFVESVDDGSLDSLDTDNEILGASESNGDVLGADYYFDSSAETDGDGTKGNPYKYLNNSRIIDDSVIHLANGVYEIHSVSPKNVKIIGQDASQTIINGNGRCISTYGNFILQNLTLNKSVIYNFGQFNASNVIFSYCNGYLDYNGYYYGGAIYSNGKSSSVYLNNCSFYNNSARYGGAIY